MFMSDNTKKIAIAWWNQLSLEERFYKVIPWLRSKNINVTERHPDTLTGTEIQEIFTTQNK